MEKWYKKNINSINLNNYNTSNVEQLIHKKNNLYQKLKGDFEKYIKQKTIFNFIQNFDTKLFNTILEKVNKNLSENTEIQKKEIQSKIQKLEKKRELERQRELEMQRQKRQKELEKQKQELERQKELEKQKQEELEIQRQKVKEEAEKLRALSADKDNYYNRYIRAKNRYNNCWIFDRKEEAEKNGEYNKYSNILTDIKIKKET